MASKEKNISLDTRELGLSKPPGPMESDSSQSSDVIDELKAEETDGGHDSMPLEKHCENLWVEVENREVKSSISLVADHLNEKFEELLQPLSAEKRAVAESASVEEEMSDKDTEVSARSTDHFSTSMQSETNSKGSAHKSLYKDGVHDQDHPASLSSSQQDLDQVTDEEHRSPSSNYIKEEKVDCSPGGPGVTKTHLDVNWKHSIANTDKTTRTRKSKAHFELEECTRSLPPLLNRNPTSVSRISDEELEEDVQRFKHEVGKLKAAFRDWDNEKPHLQKEVEDGYVLCQFSSFYWFTPSVSSPFHLFVLSPKQNQHIGFTIL